MDTLWKFESFDNLKIPRIGNFKTKLFQKIKNSEFQIFKEFENSKN
jgi:hypothetical protein